MNVALVYLAALTVVWMESLVMGDGISTNAADAEFDLQREIVITANEGLDGFVGGGLEGGDGFIYVSVYGFVD